MGLFDQELGGAPERMLWTRESGTRKLLLGFIAVLIAFFLLLKVRDMYLLREKWPALSPAANSGLTIVGTLDGRADYDRNMFRILQANQSSRVELTDRGWRDIFNGRGNDLFTDATGDIIKGAISVDGATGYAMLEPFLRVGIARQLGLPNADSLATPQTPITLQEKQGSAPVQKQVPLGELLEKFASKREGRQMDDSDSSGEGGGGDRQVDHGMAIPGDTLERICPVVMTGDHFTSASVEEHPATLLIGKTYTVHLNLTPEGRSRFYQWSRDHANENLVFILNHEVVTAGRVRETLDVSDWEIGPLRDAEAAHKLADYVNHKR